MVVWIIIAFAVAVAVTGIVKAACIKEQQESRSRSSAQNNNHIRTNTIPQRTTSNNNSAFETGPMIYYANDKHGLRDKEYKFNYKKVGSSWRAYILRTPSLGNRDTSGLVTHRLFDNGKPYVCWDSDVETLKDMQTISRYWADCIQEYIATGKRFG